VRFDTQPDFANNARLRLVNGSVVRLPVECGRPMMRSAPPSTGQVFDTSGIISAFSNVLVGNPAQQFSVWSKWHDVAQNMARSILGLPPDPKCFANVMSLSSRPVRRAHMKDRIDPLIADRAPWLFEETLSACLCRPVLNRMLGYERTIALAKDIGALPASDIMDILASNIARHVAVAGLGQVPRHGAALIVANHPTGIADGIVLHALLRQVRSDAYFFANHDILKVLPQMEDRIAPVEWRKDRRSHGKTRETMAFTRKAVKDGRLGVIFPSGRLAKRRGMRLHERPWMASAAMLARKFNLPVIPIHMQARNSALFYLFDAIHPTLRDITLFHETLNKHRQPFDVRIGEPISPKALPESNDEGIALLRRATLALGEPKQQGVSLWQSSRWSQRRA
jgi:putative hemolysin